MLKTLLRLAAAGFAATATSAAAQSLSLEPAWALDGFQSPESVALSANADFLYVSNVGGEGDARDGDGFISRIGLDGTLLTLRWATGLDAPKGMVLKDGRLLVSDIDYLAVIDAETGAVLQRIAAPGARFLNDVAAAPDGRVLVSDSANARIYVLEGGRLTVWREGEQLRAINGLLPEPDRLVITTMAGLLLAMDYATGTITLLAEGLGDGDGVAALGGGAYLVSEWPGRLFHVAADGSQTTLLDERATPVLMNDFLLVGDQLIVPNWQPGRVTAYRVRR